MLLLCQSFCRLPKILFGRIAVPCWCLFRLSGSWSRRLFRRRQWRAPRQETANDWLSIASLRSVPLSCPAFGSCCRMSAAIFGKRCMPMCSMVIGSPRSCLFTITTRSRQKWTLGLGRCWWCQIALVSVQRLKTLSVWSCGRQLRQELHRSPTAGCFDALYIAVSAFNIPFQVVLSFVFVVVMSYSAVKVSSAFSFVKQDQSTGKP